MNQATTNRRDFLKTAALFGAGAATLQAASPWAKQIGLEMWTVREMFVKDAEGTLAKVAEVGYKEIEPTSYGNLDPKAFRALMDKYKLTAPSTHAGATEGPNLEKELQGFQVMGFKYIEIRGPRIPGPVTIESTKKRSADLNRQGEIAKKFGMKMLVHNHTEEFDLLEGTKTCMYDVLLAETNPALVTMQLDIGWASVAGQNILELFKKNPGRFELWHVKDATGIKSAPVDATPAQRRKLAKLCPIGEGDVNYAPFFKQAKLAGLKHFCIEQDNAAASGDAIAAARTSYMNLMKILK